MSTGIKNNDGLTSEDLIDEACNERKPNCLKGFIFEFTGEMESSLSGEEVENLVRDLGEFV